MAINRATRRLAPPSVETGVLEGACEQRDDPLDALIRRERAERLWEALGRLKPLDRETLVAFYIQGQSLLEIAERARRPHRDHQAAAAHRPQAAQGRARGRGRRRRRVDGWPGRGRRPRSGAGSLLGCVRGSHGRPLVKSQPI